MRRCSRNICEPSASHTLVPAPEKHRVDAVEPSGPAPEEVRDRGPPKFKLDVDTTAEPLRAWADRRWVLCRMLAVDAAFATTSRFVFPRPPGESASWRCATRKAPCHRSPLQLTIKASWNPEANSEPDKTWRQNHNVTSVDIEGILRKPFGPLPMGSVCLSFRSIRTT